MLKFKEIAEDKKKHKKCVSLYVRGGVESREPTKKSAHILLLKWIFEN
jgi:hypothetical protein